MLKSNNGFSLIQVMMAVGLSSILIMGLMYTSEMMLDIKKNNDQNYEIVSAIYKVGIALNKEPVCTLYNLNQTEFNPTKNILLQNIKINPTTNLISLNSLIGNTLNVTNISVDNFQVTQATATHTDYLADLNIFISRDSGIGSKNIVRKIPLNIYAENLGPNLARILKCRANDPIENTNIASTPANFENSVCNMFGGTYNSGTGRCDGASMTIASAATPTSAPKRCGYCRKGGIGAAGTTDIPCQGVSLCSSSAKCPSNYNFIELYGGATSFGGGTERYCESM